jgi:hypothetical protein
MGVGCWFSGSSLHDEKTIVVHIVTTATSVLNNFFMVVYVVDY